ncbi:MAG TPA: hypothetical protein VFU13_03260 [Steroidobacteraceae bacterium]|nr:hypothetical protein [Steroidobacteraceae bacterium]
MRASTRKSHALAVGVAGQLLLASVPAGAYTLWSTDKTYLGTGEFHGPGTNMDNGPLFATIIREMSFVNTLDFVTPFVNNGAAEPNICGEKEMTGPVDGKLSDGSEINENVETCAAMVAGTRLLPAVVAGGPHLGQQTSVTLDSGDVVMTMDFAIDLGAGAKNVIKVPFYGSTGEIVVPHSLQTQRGDIGVDQAGIHKSGTRLRGRIGDFNKDGWIDGTIVAAGNMPLDSPFYPGQPYVIVRYFETDIPIRGELSSNIKAMKVKAGSGE